MVPPIIPPRIIYCISGVGSSPRQYSANSTVKLLKRIKLKNFLTIQVANSAKNKKKIVNIIHLITSNI